MTATVSKTVNDRGQFIATLTTNSSLTPATVGVDGLREVTIQTRRSAGAGSDTLAVTGSNDGTNFAAVTSTTQVLATGDGGDVALSALSASAAVHTIRQKPRFLRFTSSGTTDTFEIIVTGTTRN
jgi:hypothetical protein